MLRANLSTRPFYNDRGVRVALAIAVAAIAALTAFNGARILTLNQRNNEFVSRSDEAERRVRTLRDQAAATRKTLNQAEVSTVQAAAREANLLIARRAFSWTDLFNRFEETLPADVRIAAVQPQLDDQGRMLVAITVISRRVEDLDRFIDQLEGTRAFRGVLSRQEVSEEDGTLRSVIQGYYGPEDTAAAGPAPASDSAGTAEAPAPAAGPATGAPR